MLVIGQHEEAALGIFASALLALGAQHDLTTRFLILDGTQDDDPNAGFQAESPRLPHPIDFVERTTLGDQLGKLAALVTSRQKNETSDRSARYLFVHGLHRFRDLRKVKTISVLAAAVPSVSSRRRRISPRRSGPRWESTSLSGAMC